MTTPVLIVTFTILLAYRSGALKNLAGAINGSQTVGV